MMFLPEFFWSVKNLFCLKKNFYLVGDFFCENFFFIMTAIFFTKFFLGGNDYSDDSFAVENTQAHHSLRQMMDQVNKLAGLIRAAETNDSDTDSGDIADLEANNSDADESLLLNDYFFSIMKRLNHGQKINE